MTLNERGTFLAQYLVVGLAFGVVALRPLVFVPIITGQMGKETYGIWAQVMVTSLLLGPILTLQINLSLGRFLPGRRSDRDLSRTYLFSILVILMSAFSLKILRMRDVKGLFSRKSANPIPTL